MRKSDVPDLTASSPAFLTGPLMDSEKTCSACYARKPVSEFGIRIKNSAGGQKGDPTAKCKACMDRDRVNKANRKRRLDEDSELPDSAGGTTPLTVSLADFLDLLVEGIKNSDFEISGRVDISDSAFGSTDGSQIANGVAQIIGNYTKFHWTQALVKKILKYQKSQEVVSHAEWTDSLAMAGFELQSLLIRKWKQEIEKKAKSHTPGQIWRYLLEETSLGKSVSEIDIPFRQKAVYYHWHVKFILEDGRDHQVKALDVLPEPGTQAMAFQIVDFMQAWAPNTQELAMDSTWNTNGAGFELFAAVASAEGSGIPLAYCLIKTSKEAQPGAKQIILTRFLTQLKAHGINPEVTLSDKDWSEINAMQDVWPKAKHQLCFWHTLQALKRRLANSRTLPAIYNPEEAHSKFSFIRTSFVPIYQLPEGSKDVPNPPAKPIPRVRLLINGRPPTLTPSIPKIRIPPRKSLSDNSQPVYENFNLEEELLEQPENSRDFLEEQDFSDEELFWTKGMSKNKVSEDEEGPSEWWEWDDVESISDEAEDIHRLFDDRDADTSRGVHNFTSNSDSESELDINEAAEEDQM
ncbi:hypothetical protein NLI96_g12987 [Meripilus lineatus]|uniref:MULE transposase domain-containing protein n=1 Tax=Meripilus lineatus TaxID=2056292 RepID=A0AAD5UNW8_9APHY|nr:hypothetical protein NLI96_g12987 [Physisporinus lineatus]